MSTIQLPLISVQTDWDQVVREVVSDKASDSFFWIACYVTGKPSVQGQVEVIKKDNGENLPCFCMTDKNLMMTLEEGRTRTCLLPRRSALLMLFKQSFKTETLTMFNNL
ncbi:hypothetical protein RMATCC62417_13034 [Rhizopus microsporus]|nr:hypothetical protein RMATCC62417_13034 [Rhizopus microsporus]